MLTKALDDPAEEVRRRALQLGARMPPGPVGTGAPEGPDDVDAPEGAEAGPERSAFAARVVAALAHAALAEEGAFCLGELGVAEPVVVTALERQALHHDDVLCRESAVAALGSLGAGRETVLLATGDVATVRRRAVIALAAFDGDDVDAALRRALDDRDWQVRQAAEDLLPLGGEPEPEPDDRDG